MFTPSNLSSKQLCNNYILGAIPMYLHEGETSEQIIKKFKGDIIKAIQFLRERSYASLKIVERKSKPAVKEKPTKKIKGKSKVSFQEKLF